MTKRKTIRQNDYTAGCSAGRISRTAKRKDLAKRISMFILSLVMIMGNVVLPTNVFAEVTNIDENDVIENIVHKVDIEVASNTADDSSGVYSCGAQAHTAEVDLSNAESITFTYRSNWSSTSTSHSDSIMIVSSTANFSGKKIKQFGETGLRTELVGGEKNVIEWDGLGKDYLNLYTKEDKDTEKVITWTIPDTVDRTQLHSCKIAFVSLTHNESETQGRCLASVKIADVSYVNRRLISSDQSVDYGKSASFSVSATGSELDYQWKDKNNTNVGTNSPTLTINNATEDNSYYCVISDINGSYESAAAKLTINAPSFVTQPASTVLSNKNVGDSVTLSVTTKSCDNSTAQWYKDGVAIQGATGISYTMDILGSNHNAKYTCKVSGTSTIESTPVTCTIAAPYSANSNYPKDVSAVEGSSATFSLLDEESKPIYKNAASVQWQAKMVDGWMDISGATGNDCTVQNVTRSMNGRKYRAKLIGYNTNAGDVYTREATLSCSEGQPEFVTEPKDTGNVEGRQAIFSAIGNNYTQTYQWRYKKAGESSFTKFVDTTNVADDEMQVAGSKTNTLTLTNLKLDFDQAKIQCYILNENKYAEKDVTLSVMRKEVSGFTTSYPFAVVDYGTPIRTEDLFTFVKYTSGDAEMSRNFTGVTFDDGTVEKTETSLGTFDYVTKWVYDDTTFTSGFSVEVKDQSAPEIDSTEIVWEDTREELSNSNLSNDTSRNILLSATATDNYEPAENITYQWIKGTVVIGEGNSIMIPSGSLEVNGSTVETGNGVYILRVLDSSGNYEDKEIRLDAWDTTAPIIEHAIVSPDTAYAQYRSVEVVANDDIGLAPMAYSFDNGFSWVRSSTYVYTKNSIDEGYDTGYPIYVRDRAGNVSECMNVNIDSIDKEAPVLGDPAITRTVEDMIEGVDGSGTVYVQVNATDNCSLADNLKYTCIYTTNGNIVEDSNNTGRFSIISQNLDSESMINCIFYIEDEAGNRLSISSAIDPRPTYHAPLQEKLNNSLFATPYPDWVNKETGVTIGCNVSGTDPEKDLSMDDFYNDASLGMGFKFSCMEAEQYENTIIVHENGEYTVTVTEKTRDGLRNDDHYFESNPIIVDNIDDQAPIADIAVDGSIIHVTASDEQSGIKQIIVSGGEYGSGITQYLFTEGYPSTQSFDIEAHQNATYRILVEDAVGNINQGSDGEAGADVEAEGQLEIKQGQVQLSQDTTRWTNNNVTVNAMVSEELQPVLSSLPYYWSNENGRSMFADTLATENGDIDLALEDVWGNIYESEDWKIDIENIDKKAPSVLIAQTGSNMTVYAKDPASGITYMTLENNNTGKTRTLYVSSDSSGEGIKELTEDVSICSNDSYTIKCFDKAGNGSQVSLTATGVPEITPEILKACVVKSPTDFTSGNVTLTLNLPQEYLTQLGSRSYSWDNDYTRTTSPVINVDKNGTYTVSVLLKDDTIVTSDGIEVTNIDRNAPKAVIGIDGNKATITVTDEGSGVASIVYSIAGESGGSYFYDTGLNSVTESFVLSKDGTYVFTLRDKAGNESTVLQNVRGTAFTQENIDAWLTITNQSSESAVLTCNVPAECWPILAEKPFLWSGKQYTDVMNKRVTANGTYYVTVKAADGRVIKSKGLKVTCISKKEADNGDDGGSSSSGGSTYVAPVTPTPTVSANNPVQTIIRYITTGGNKTTGDESDKKEDKTGPELTLSENNMKILITVSDNDAGIQKVTCQVDKEKEKTIFAPNGSKSAAFSVDPGRNGSFIFTAYDMNDNKTQKGIVITDYVPPVTVSDDSVNSSKADVTNFANSDEETISNNTVSENIVVEETDSGISFFTWFVPLLIILILIAIGVLYWYTKKKEKTKDEDLDDLDDDFFEEDEENADSEENDDNLAEDAASDYSDDYTDDSYSDNSYSDDAAEFDDEPSCSKE